MPRKLRIQYPDAIYHLMSRADGKGDILLNDMDRQHLLTTPAQVLLRLTAVNCG